jgi:hypothetical protein
MRSPLAANSVGRGDFEFAATGSRNLSDKLFAVLVTTARFIFLVKKIFLSHLKIKFIFFLSLSQLISSLKPAGEDDHKACVNKL